MERLEKIQKLIEREQKIKAQQAELDKDFNDFMSKEIGVQGPATLLDISKRLLETSFDESRIIMP
jgi:hypothetical protein